MRSLFLRAASALLLAGCATTALPPYGNYLQSPAADQQKLAGEAVRQLVTLYPPARISLELRQPTPDAFGAALVRDLRDSGYAVLEFKPEATGAQAQTAPEDANARPLRYVIDQAGTSNLYRLTLLVGAQSLTRPYLQQDGALVPPGYWVRKE